jgi:hypothetical protein
MPHTILFSGHMIDRPDRPTPRFPASKEASAGQSILQALRKTQAAAGKEDLRGIAAAACGGDILFHEACQALHIPSEIYLAIPVDAFRQTSVSPGGPQWQTRYERLVRALPVHVLFPEATADIADEVWEKANQWMLDTALADGGGANLTILSLWDGDKGNTGGTGHMIEVGKAQHATIDIIDPHTLANGVDP